jgi:hypothetical protein
VVLAPCLLVLEWSSLGTSIIEILVLMRTSRTNSYTGAGSAGLGGLKGSWRVDRLGRL